MTDVRVRCGSDDPLAIVDAAYRAAVAIVEEPEPLSNYQLARYEGALAVLRAISVPEGVSLADAVSAYPDDLIVLPWRGPDDEPTVVTR